MKEQPFPAKSLSLVTRFLGEGAKMPSGRELEPLDDTEVLRRRYERILSSAQFARSERLCKLLLHLLRAMDFPTGAPVSERSIGIEVFERELDWDPTVDPCVRVAMGRLRAKLKDYYENIGKNDEVRIVLSKGSYLPQVVLQPVPSRDTAEPRNVVVAPPMVRHPRRSLLLFLITIGMVAIVALIVWREWKPSQRRVLSCTIVPFSTELGAQFSPAISPDGRSMAYVWDGNQNSFHMYVRPLDGGIAAKLTGGTGSDFYPAWSPDGTRLAFLRNEGWEGKLIVKPIDGGPEQVVATIATAPGRWTEDIGPLLGNPGPVWSGDGRELIAFDQGHFGIYAISIATGERRQLTADTQTSRDFYPRLSPDGKMLAFVHYVSHGVGDLYLLPMERGAKPRRITYDERTIRGITWAADGQSLVFASNRNGAFELWRMNVRSGALETLPSDTSQAANPAMAPDGSWLAFDNSHENINIQQAAIAATGRSIQMHPIVSSLGRNRGASLSPDGRRLLFVSDRSGSWQIWVSVPDGSAPRQLTHLKGSLAGGINWSPDNRHIVFDTRPAGHSSIFQLDVDTGKSQILSRSSAEERTPSWAPDGRSIYFSSDRDGSVSLYRMNKDSGATSLVVHHGFRAQVTEDNRWVYFSTLYAVLWRIPVNGGDATQLPEALQPYSSSTWTVAGNNLLVLKKSSQKMVFDLWKADTHLATVHMGEITIARDSDVLGISASANGSALMVDTRDQITSDIVLRGVP